MVGNHEHVNKYPKLYTSKYINERIQELNNDKIVYLPEQDWRSGLQFLSKSSWDLSVAYYMVIMICHILMMNTEFTDKGQNLF